MPVASCSATIGGELEVRLRGVGLPHRGIDRFANTERWLNFLDPSPSDASEFFPLLLGNRRLWLSPAKRYVCNPIPGAF